MRPLVDARLGAQSTRCRGSGKRTGDTHTRLMRVPRTNAQRCRRDAHQNRGLDVCTGRRA